MAVAVVGSVTGAAMVCPPAAGAWGLRRRFLTEWSGAAARLAEAILTLGAVLAVSQLLGVVGALRRLPLVAGCVAVGLVMTAVGLRGSRTGALRVEREPLGASPHRSAALAVLAVLVVALVGGQWAANVRTASVKGIVEHDSVYYHLPHAARFVHDASITELDVTMFDPLTSFHPENGELVIADTMLAFRSDVLVPYVSLLWLALALLASWVIGQRLGAGAMGLVGGALMMGSPLMVAEAGTARVDVAVAGLILACAALLIEGGWTWTAVTVAGLAGGMALGTKFTVAPLLFALTVALVVLAPNAKRMVIGLAWTASLVSLAAVWYARNWWRAGSPVPTVHVRLGPVAFLSPPLPILQRYPTPTGPYLFRSGFLHTIPPQLHDLFGGLWPLWLLFALGGLALTAARPADRMVLAVAVAGLVGVVAYFFTPLTVFGNPLVIRGGIRFSAFVPALGLVLLPSIGALGRRGRDVLLAGELAVLAAMQPLLRHLTATSACVLTGLGVVGAALAMLALKRLADRPMPVYPGAVAVLVGGVAVLGGRPVAGYAYPTLPPPDGPGVAAVWQWAAHEHGQRIGYARFVSPYPLYGRDLSNTAVDVGQHGPHGAFSEFRTCDGWRHALASGRYRYVVVGPNDASNDEFPAVTQGPEGAWTRTITGVHEPISQGNYSVFDVAHANLTQPCTPE